MKTIIQWCLYFSVITTLSGCLAAKNYDMSSGKEYTLSGLKSDIFLTTNFDWHGSMPMEPIVSKDGRYIVSYSSDKRIIVTDLKENTNKIIYNEIGFGNFGYVQSAAISPNGKYLVAGGEFSYGDSSPEDVEFFGAIRVYDLQTLKMVQLLKHDSRTISSLSFSSDGGYLVSSSSLSNTDLGGHINVWDMEKFTLVSSERIISKNIVKVANDKGKHVLFIGDFNGKIIKKDLLTSKTLKEFQIPRLSERLGDTFQISSLVIGENEIAVASRSSTVIVFLDLDLNFKVQTIVHTKLRNLDYSPDRRYILASLQGNEKSAAQGIKIFDRHNNNQEITHFHEHDNNSQASFLGNNNVVSIGGEKNSLLIWDMFTKKIIKRIDGTPRFLGLGVQNNTIAIGSKNKFTNVNNRAEFEKAFDLETMRVVSPKGVFQRFSDIKDSSELSVDFIHKMDALILRNNGKVINFHPYEGGVSANAFGFFKNYIVTGGYSGKVKVYDQKFEPLGELRGHTGNIWALGTYKNFLISTGSSSTIHFWDLSNFKGKEYLVDYPRLSLVLLPDNEWIMWTDEGYFNASENGHKYIGFHLNQGYEKNANYISSDKLYDHFFRPDLVKLKLQGEDISKYTNGVTYKEVLKNLPPTVSIASVNGAAINATDKKANLATPTAKLSFNVTENNGGSGLIRIYQEGKLVQTIGSGQVNRQSADADVKAQEAQIDKKSKEAQTIYLAKVEDTVTKSLGREFNANELVETVTISDGSAVSTKGTHTIELPLKAGNNTISIEAFNKTNTVASYRDSVTINASIKPKAPKIYAIALGVNTFEQSSVSPLKYSENDAKVIAEKIKKATSYQTDVTLLTGKNMTKENIQKALKSIKAKAGLEDKVIFYVSTHGKAVNGNLFLVPQNNKSVKNWINFEELFKEVQSISALDQIFVIDACESGKASDIMASVYDAKTSVLAKQSGVHVLMATTKGTFAFEHPDKNVQHGVFTYNILKALDDPKTDKNADKWISVVELSKTLQEPANNAEHQFPIIRNVGQDTQIRNLK